MNCSKCGSAINDKMVFCTQCGNKIDMNASAPRQGRLVIDSLDLDTENPRSTRLQVNLDDWHGDNEHPGQTKAPVSMTQHSQKQTLIALNNPSGYKAGPSNSSKETPLQSIPVMPATPKAETKPWVSAEEAPQRNGDMNHSSTVSASYIDATNAANLKRYAGFWVRLGAYLIDVLIMVIFGFIIGLLEYMVAGPKGNLFFEFIYRFAAFPYFIYFESSERQATPGKRAMGLIVVDEKGGRISGGQATGRTFGKLLSGLILGIGYLMVGFTEKKQGLHDKMAGTYVVYK